jgi:hypothetical protein
MVKTFKSFFLPKSPLLLGGRGDLIAACSPSLTGLEEGVGG